MSYEHMTREQLIEELKNKDKIIESIKRQASIDYLTEVFNRKQGIENLHKEIKKAKEMGQKLTIGFADVNNLKYINDNYGHNAGDTVLKTLCKIIENNIKKDDFIFRYGGDEFVIVLPKTNLKESIMVWKKIKDNIEEINSSFIYDVGINCGFVECNEHFNKSVKDLIDIADYRMYKDKTKGR